MHLCSFLSAHFALKWMRLSLGTDRAPGPAPAYQRSACLYRGNRSTRAPPPPRVRGGHTRNRRISLVHAHCAGVLLIGEGRVILVVCHRFERPGSKNTCGGSWAIDYNFLPAFESMEKYRLFGVTIESHLATPGETQNTLSSPSYMNQWKGIGSQRISRGFAPESILIYRFKWKENDDRLSIAMGLLKGVLSNLSINCVILRNWQQR